MKALFETNVIEDFEGVGRLAVREFNVAEALAVTKELSKVNSDGITPEKITESLLNCFHAVDACVQLYVQSGSVNGNVSYTRYELNDLPARLITEIVNAVLGVNESFFVQVVSQISQITQDMTTQVEESTKTT